MAEKSSIREVQFFPISPSKIRGRVWDAPAALRLWHLTSLDAPTVAVTWAIALAWAARVRLPEWVYVAQGLATWSVYVGDRLLDARRSLQAGHGEHLRERHRFHWRHRRILAPLAIAAAVIAACLVAVFLPAGARVPAVLVGGAATLYLIGVHAKGAFAPSLFAQRLMPGKEFLVGVLFAAGCAIPAWRRGWGHRLELLLAAAFFAALAWLNCRAIGCWEDGLEGRAVMRNGAMLALAGILAGALTHAADPRFCDLLWAGAAGALLLAVLECARDALAPLALRALADLVLLTPLALLLQVKL